MRYRKPLPFAALLAACAVVAAPAAAASASEERTDAVQARAADSQVIELAHPVTLAAATEAAQGVEEVLGFRFESNWNEGEFFLGAGMSPEEFAQAFETVYGTQVEVSGFVADSGGAQARSAGASTLAGAVERAAEFPEFAASHPRDPLIEPRDEPVAADAGTAATRTVSAAAADANTWAPNYTETYAMDLSAVGVPGIHAIGTYNEWSPASAYAIRSPKNMPADWGMEIDVYLRNPNLTGDRPNCNRADYRDQFWAKKYNVSGDAQVISWSVSKADGTAISSNSTAGSAEPYFDWDDAFDACTNQSFGIGIGNPAGIGLSQAASYQSPYYGVNTSVWAAPGAQTSSYIGAYYQAVSNDCNDLGSFAASSCMGLNVSRAFPASAGEQSQLILNSANRYAPRCHATSAFPSPNAWVIDCFW